MNDQVKALLDKLPIVPALIAALGYLGWTYYTFTTDPSSPLLQKQQQVTSLQAETAATKAKLQKAQEFFRTLEGRRSELRQLALQLEETKASLSEQMDISSFVRMVVDEANKVGMTVVGIKPTENHKEEYYAQQSFELKFHGVFVQLVVFMERLANLERIVRFGEVHLKPASAASNTFVELDGVLQLNTYRYLGSRADELTKGQASSQPVPQITQPAQTAPAQSSPAQTSSAQVSPAQISPVQAAAAAAKAPAAQTQTPAQSAVQAPNPAPAPSQVQAPKGATQ